jgi:hypothetical protein
LNISCGDRKIDLELDDSSRLRIAFEASGEFFEIPDPGEKNPEVAARLHWLTMRLTTP